MAQGVEEEVDEEERVEARGGGGGLVVAVARLKATRELVGAGARVLFYPTLLYNVLRNRFDAEFRWRDRVDQLMQALALLPLIHGYVEFPVWRSGRFIFEYVLLGALRFSSDVPRLKQLGVRGVVTLNEPYETLVPTSLYQETRHKVVALMSTVRLEGDEAPL